jgi:hypothetical protein
LFEEDSESESEDKQVKDSIALGRDEEGDDVTVAEFGYPV